MSRHPTNNERKPEFLKLHADYPKWSFNKIALHMGIGKNIVQRWVTEAGLRKCCIPSQPQTRVKKVKLIDHVPRSAWPPNPPHSDAFREDYDLPA